MSKIVHRPSTELPRVKYSLSTVRRTNTEPGAVATGFPVRDTQISLMKVFNRENQLSCTYNVDYSETWTRSLRLPVPYLWGAAPTLFPIAAIPIRTANRRVLPALALHNDPRRVFAVFHSHRALRLRAGEACRQSLLPCVTLPQY